MGWAAVFYLLHFARLLWWAFPTAILGPPQRSDCVVQQPACTFWAGLQVEGHLDNSRWALPFCSHECAHAVDTCCGTFPVMPQHAGVSFKPCTMLWASIPGQRASQALPLSWAMPVGCLLCVYAWATLFCMLIGRLRHALCVVEVAAAVLRAVCVLQAAPGWSHNF